MSCVFSDHSMFWLLCTDWPNRLRKEWNTYSNWVSSSLLNMTVVKWRERRRSLQVIVLPRPVLERNELRTLTKPQVRELHRSLDELHGGIIENLRGAHVVTKFPNVYTTRRFLAMVTRWRYWTTLSARCIQSTTSHSVFFKTQSSVNVFRPNVCIRVPTFPICAV